MGLDSLLPLLVQVPLVGIFIVFTLIMLRSFIDFLDRRDTQWQAFLQQQSDRSTATINAAATRIEAQIQLNSTELRTLSTLLNTHDARVRREEGA